MAQFKLQASDLPTDIINDLYTLNSSASEMFEEMTQEGAKVVESEVRKNMSTAFKKTDTLGKHLGYTQAYHTPSDDGINTKVGFYGYMVNENGQRVPAPLVALAREYGTSSGERKKPFLRPAFNKKKSEIESAMEKVEGKYFEKLGL